MSSYDFETQDPQDSVRISGRIKWFDAGKGYGFIVPDDPQQTGLTAAFAVSARAASATAAASAARWSPPVRRSGRR